MNGRPLSHRKIVRVLIALMLLMWATQMLLHQWAHGQEQANESEPVASQRFVPGTDRTAIGATLEVRAEATVIGSEIKLGQVCRWSNADRAQFAPLANLTVARCKGAEPFRSVSLDEIRQTLHDAGVNLAAIRFAGTVHCVVARGDVKYDEQSALQQWIDARQGKAPSPIAPATQGASSTPGTPATSPVRPAASRTPTARNVAPAKAPEAPTVHTLRDLILADAAVRLGVAAEQLQMTFNPADESLLRLSEPQFKFNLEARSVHQLGDVSWDVLIVTDTGTKRAAVAATARAWQEQVVVTRPMAYRQVIQKTDVTERRVLSDQLPYEPLLSLAQVVGQETARELKPGTVLTAQMVSPIELAKPGQLINVSLSSGNVRIKTVAQAMEAGSFGQTIRARNEATREVYEVVLTGPQEGTMSPVVK